MLCIPPLWAEYFKLITSNCLTNPQVGHYCHHLFLSYGGQPRAFSTFPRLMTSDGPQVTYRWKPAIFSHMATASISLSLKAAQFLFNSVNVLIYLPTWSIQGTFLVTWLCLCHLAHFWLEPHLSCDSAMNSKVDSVPSGGGQKQHLPPGLHGAYISCILSQGPRALLIN